jgi:hypothetical protein
MLNDKAHSIYRHHIANSSETPCSGLPNNGKAASQGYNDHGEELLYFWPQLLMKRRHDGLQNTERVDDILPVLQINQIVRGIRRVCESLRLNVDLKMYVRTG